MERYLLGECVGHGGCASVYLGIDVDTQEQVAVKKISHTNRKAVEQFQNEFNLLHEAQHPHVVSVREFIVEGHEAYIVMEWMSSSVTDLLRKIGKTHLHESIIRSYIRQALEGLDYLHSHSIVHRDVTPNNMLVCKDGTLKLSDFGISRIVARTAERGEVVTQEDAGTTEYRSPESILRQVISASGDVWSLAASMSHMATGCLPWSHCTFASRLELYMHIGRLGSDPATARETFPEQMLHPHIPTHLSAVAQDFMAKCFVLDHTQRPTSAELMHHPFITQGGGSAVEPLSEYRARAARHVDPSTDYAESTSWSTASSEVHTTSSLSYRCHEGHVLTERRRFEERTHKNLLPLDLRCSVCGAEIMDQKCCCQDDDNNNIKAMDWNVFMCRHCNYVLCHDCQLAMPMTDSSLCELDPFQSYVHRALPGAGGQRYIAWDGEDNDSNSLGSNNASAFAQNFHHLVDKVRSFSLEGNVVRLDVDLGQNKSTTLNFRVGDRFLKSYTRHALAALIRALSHHGNTDEDEQAELIATPADESRMIGSELEPAASEALPERHSSPHPIVELVDDESIATVSARSATPQQSLPHLHQQHSFCLALTSLDRAISFVEDLHLSRDYRELMAEENIDWEVLLSMTEDDLKSVGFTFGDRRKVSLALRRAREMSTGRGSPPFTSIAAAEGAVPPLHPPVPSSSCVPSMASSPSPSESGSATSMHIHIPPVAFEKDNKAE
eukprot:PhM_4_TR14737/c0_g1_i1/m.2004